MSGLSEEDAHRWSALAATAKEVKRAYPAIQQQQSPAMGQPTEAIIQLSTAVSNLSLQAIDMTKQNDVLGTRGVQADLATFDDILGADIVGANSSIAKKRAASKNMFWTPADDEEVETGGEEGEPRTPSKYESRKAGRVTKQSKRPRSQDKKKKEEKKTVGTTGLTTAELIATPRRGHSKTLVVAVPKLEDPVLKAIEDEQVALDKLNAERTKKRAEAAAELRKKQLEEDAKAPAIAAVDTDTDKKKEKREGEADDKPKGLETDEERKKNEKARMVTSQAHMAAERKHMRTKGLDMARVAIKANKGRELIPYKFRRVDAFTTHQFVKFASEVNMDELCNKDEMWKAANLGILISLYDRPSNLTKPALKIMTRRVLATGLYWNEKEHKELPKNVLRICCWLIDSLETLHVHKHVIVRESNDFLSRVKNVDEGGMWGWVIDQRNTYVQKVALLVDHRDRYPNIEAVKEALTAEKLVASPIETRENEQLGKIQQLLNGDSKGVTTEDLDKMADNIYRFSGTTPPVYKDPNDEAEEGEEEEEEEKGEGDEKQPPQQQQQQQKQQRQSDAGAEAEDEKEKLVVITDGNGVDFELSRDKEKKTVSGQFNHEKIIAVVPADQWKRVRDWTRVRLYGPLTHVDDKLIVTVAGLLIRWGKETGIAVDLRDERIYRYRYGADRPGEQNIKILIVPSHTHEQVFKLFTEQLNVLIKSKDEDATACVSARFDVRRKHTGEEDGSQYVEFCVSQIKHA